MEGHPNLDAFISLAEETKDLYAISHIERIEMPSPLEFYREYVSQNKPVIITGAFNHWKALSTWNNDYLRRKLGDKEVTVDVTPLGHGDTVVDGTYFVKPVEKRMKFNHFMDFIERKSDTKGVYYIQHQNGNFPVEFEELKDDVDPEVDWASEAFGSSPDAVNFWMGDDRAVSSLHKDHYENIYVVVTGSKQFTLLPPTDLCWLYEGKYTSSTYQEIDGKFTIKEDEPHSKIPWIPVDPNHPDMEKFPLFKYASPVKCTLLPGEMLYLPSMWFHRVSQKGDEEGRTIAVNYWYDMKYGANWCYLKFLEKIISYGKNK